MASITSIGIWSLSFKIWFKSVAAETHFHKKDGSSGAGPGVETFSLSAAPQLCVVLLGVALLSASVSPAPLKGEVALRLRNIAREGPQPLLVCTL